jgi:PD-(D/E)XK nuclease superfamily
MSPSPYDLNESELAAADADSEAPDMKPTFRCSSLPTLLLCPGAKALSEHAKPRQTGSSQALAGVWCHARGAQRLRDEESACGPEIVLPDLPADRFKEWIASYWVDTVRMFVEPHQGIEYEAEMQWEFDGFILTGHLDMLAIDADATEFVIGDLKSGSDPVTPAPDNAQVLGYSVLAALNYPTVQKGTLFLCQPLADESAGFERVTVSRAPDRKTLDAQVAYLERELNHVLDHELELNSGWRQCHYCPAALICPAFECDISTMRMTLIPAQLAALPSEPSLEKLFAFEAARKQFAEPLDLAHETLKARVAEMGGAELADGTKLLVVDRPGAREITDNAAATQRLNDMPEELFHRCYKYRPGEMEAALAEWLQLPKTSKKGASGQSAFKERFGDIVKQEMNQVLKIA